MLLKRGDAARTSRETRTPDTSVGKPGRQIPLSGNPPAVLAPQRTADAPGVANAALTPERMKMGIGHWESSTAHCPIFKSVYLNFLS
ncbi:MAG: hypothetical protein KME30_09585 [Iphinoe sp. HA4291-MV1]|nr:hypothetical protein [Iphinoe sp. HA4291-MV1]